MKNKHDLLFIHIPKTGGTSVKTVLLAEKCLYTRPWKHRHESATQMKHLFGTQKFDALSKFTIVRNPYDRLVSYYYRNREERKAHPTLVLTFREYVKWACSHPKGRSIAPQAEQVLIDGVLAIDRLLRFESLVDDWKNLAEEYGLPAELPHINASTLRPPFEECFDGMLSKLVLEAYKEDFSLFGY